MYLESLLRLAEIMSHFNESGEKLIDEKFHKETTELIESQTNFLVADLEFKANDPGPYEFGFGDLHIVIYSPDDTGIQEWAAIARKGTWQKSYKFNSILGLVKVLIFIINDKNEEIEKNE